MFESDTQLPDDDLQDADFDDEDVDFEYVDIDALDADITEDEVVAAIKNLKDKKAAGPDGIIPEIFKHSSQVIVPFLVDLFNHIFSTGQFPQAWTEAMIHPLHKKGNVNDPDNYRGISLLNICSKLYSFVLNKRLSDFVEKMILLVKNRLVFARIIQQLIIFLLCLP